MRKPVLANQAQTEKVLGAAEAFLRTVERVARDMLGQDAEQKDLDASLASSAVSVMTETLAKRYGVSVGANMIGQGLGLSLAQMPVGMRLVFSIALEDGVTMGMQQGVAGLTPATQTRQ